jgi:hypothetical protein
MLVKYVELAIKFVTLHQNLNVSNYRDCLEPHDSTLNRPVVQNTLNLKRTSIKRLILLSHKAMFGFHDYL